MVENWVSAEDEKWKRWSVFQADHVQLIQELNGDEFTRLFCLNGLQRGDSPASNESLWEALFHTDEHTHLSVLDTTMHYKSMVPVFLLSFRFFCLVSCSSHFRDSQNHKHLCLQSSTVAAWKALHKNTPEVHMEKKTAQKTPGRCPSLATRPPWCHQACGVEKISFHVWVIQFQRHWQYREDNCASSSINGFWRIRFVWTRKRLASPLYKHVFRRGF